MSSHRNTYRVGQRRRFLSVTLRTAEGTSYEGYVEDLSGHGCRAVFDNPDGNDLADGLEVDLSFHALLLPDPLEVKALVRHTKIETVKGTSHYGFEFVNPAAVRREVPYVLLREFNRRSAPRLPVEDSVQVDLDVIDESDGLNATLIDVSRGGLRLRVDPARNTELMTGGRLLLRFRLPEFPEEFRFLGTVCRLDDVDGQLEACVEFDDSMSLDFMAQQASIEAYVTHRLKNPPTVES